MDHHSNLSAHTSPSFHQSIEQNMMMCDPLTILKSSTKYPWLVTNQRKQDGGKEERLCIVNDKQESRLHEFGIRKLVGKRYRACFHGWMILSDEQNVMWSLWNPVTSKFIHLPPMLFEITPDVNGAVYCCLSSEPYDICSILLLRVPDKPNFICCRVGAGYKKRRWIEISYLKQLKSLGGNDDDLLYYVTCSNGKVYALEYYTINCVIHVDILVNPGKKDKEEVVINLWRGKRCPFRFIFDTTPWAINMLKGYGTDLFYIELGIDVKITGKVSHLKLFKLDMTKTLTSSTWEEITDLKDCVFFLDHGECFSVSYKDHAVTVTSEEFGGGYIHVRGGLRGVIYSYHVKDRTVSLMFMPHLKYSTKVSLWESRLQGDDGEATHTIDEYKLKKHFMDDEISITSVTNDVDDELNNNNNSMTNESHLLSVPFHILERFMDFCVGIEFLKFRATCKLCHLAAPLMRMRDEAGLMKLRAYSFASPLLMVVEKNRGIINFTDPVFGDKYFMNTSVIASHEKEEIFIYCCRYGWLLFYSSYLRCLVFFNPFTKDVHKLPATALFLETLCFSAPPTSPNCVVVGFTTKDDGHAYILHFVADQEPLPSWHIVDLDYGSDAPYKFRFPTFNSRDLYALSNEGQLVVFKEISEDSSSWEVVVAEAPKCYLKIKTQYYLVKRDQHLLLVILGVFGDHLEVFQLNDSSTEWKKIDSLGKYTIYISNTTCFCIETRKPEMKNKIYFPHLHTKNGMIVFYSLEKSGYYTFDGDETPFRGFYLGTKYHLNPYAWIEPSWC